ncbi:protein Dr1-like [Orbicella faveolata]|uniref:protein Dr1-like n=1 Tax=Orbicella faveolata TaxID=48498 RepID=UPI0009E57508|nr:protein Dr1-like [Orbicella faveolata]
MLHPELCCSITCETLFCITAAVNKMIKEMIPNVRVSNDARELILNCCTEFIHLVSSEANEICNRQLKKTILPEHVFQALQGLGFHSYIEEVRSVLQECKTQAANKRRASTRLENLVCLFKLILLRCFKCCAQLIERLEPGDYF